jgi:tetratricopeptide (TPR) repeat protein
MTAVITEVLKNGITAHQAGDLDRAAEFYNKILGEAPEHADATHLMGLVHFQRGQNDVAATMIRAAINLDPKVPLYHANLGRVFMASRDDAGALVAFREAVLLEPENAPLHADLAGAMLRCGDAEEARVYANTALELLPDLAEAHLNLGLSLQTLYGPAFNDAVQALQRAIELNPVLAGAYLGLGVALHEQGEHEAAERTYAHALSLDPSFIEAHCNLGNLKRAECAFKEAAQHYGAALKLDNNQAVVWGNLGVVLQEAGDLDEALAAYDRAILLDPENAEMRRNRGIALLAAGRFVEGWSDYEYRLDTERFQILAREWPVPKWNGRDPDGLRILVHAEQGYGDTLQFCRYVPMLSKLGARVTVECADSLMPVMRSLNGVQALITPGDELSDIDCNISLMSLPGALGTTLETIPCDAPYLTSPAVVQKKWAEIAQDWPAGKRVGVAWRGSPEHPRDALRSPGLQPFLDLIEQDNIVLVSLQKDGGGQELAALDDRSQVIDPTHMINDFGDTAALIETLDVVISCDSAPLHLSGALGKRTIAVLPHVAEWRWGRDGDTTPWYPSMTLVRQPKAGDWHAVFDVVKKALR